MLTRRILFSFIVSTSMVTPLISFAQVATGTYALGTYDSLGPDTINVGNLNVMLDVPVLHKAGRAGTNFTYDLFYNGAIWTPTAGAWVPDSYWGWVVDTQPLTGYISQLTYSNGGSCSGRGRQIIVTISNVDYYDRFGTQHPFRGERVVNDCTGATTDTLTNTWSQDHLFYYSSAGITDARGIKINAPINTSYGTSTYTDTNGNQISTDGNGNFTDTTGNVVLAVTGAAPSNKVFTYKDANGTTRTVTIGYTNYAIATNFGCSGLTEYSNSSVPLISTITFPDSTSYSFTYEHASGTAAGSVTGRLASIQIPTGGIVSYSYPGANSGINCKDGSAIGLGRMQSSTPGTPARTYTKTSAGTAISHTSVLDEQGNDTEYDFVQGANGTQSTTNYYETARTVYQGNAGGTPLLARQTCYNQATQPCNQQTITPPITQTDTYQTLDGVAQSGTTVQYDSFLDVTSVATNDFGTATARGTVLQTETTPYTNGYIQSDSVTDSIGHLLSSTSYSYGSGAVATSGVPSFSATSTGMNVVSVQRSILGGTGSSYNQRFTYYNTGSLYSFTGAIGASSSATTSLSYDSTNTFANGVSVPSPTGVTLTTSAATDLVSGIALSSTGMNGAVTTNSNFDPYGRPQNSVVTLAGTTIGQLSATYQPNHVQAFSYQSGSVSTESDAYYDAYGRLIRSATQASASPALFYISDTCYDSFGRVNFKSYPYSASSVTGSEVCSGAGDTYTYDALGRQKTIQHADTGNTSISYIYYGSASKVTDENGVSHIYQVDGLGRTLIVCEISANASMPNSGSPTSCGTLIAGLGFVTNYAYLNNVTTITQGVQTRTFTFDGLRRLTAKSEGELTGTSFTSATTTYSYTTNATGQVVTRTTPRANQTNPAVVTTTTYQYDLLGRIISTTYNDGITPTKTFTYDQAMSGSSFSTGASLGMMTAASNTASTTQFRYDPLGRLTGTTQCLAGMCGATPTWVTRSYGYDWQSNQTNEQYSTPAGIVGLTYGVNLAGQMLSVTGGQDSAVSSSLYTAPPATMSPFGPAAANYGNGIAATMSYDVFGNPTGLGLTQSSNPLYAWTATWSGSRVSGSQDSINGGNASYTYDDMNRLSGATMGSLSLSWAYDRYGNRWSQSASGSWPGTVSQPSLNFSNATNHVASAGYAYDVAGNLIQDPLHTYTYDADGNLTAIDGGFTAAYQFDALNRRVQTVTSSGTQEFDFNAASQRATVWDGSGNLVSAQYYVAGKPFAYYLASDSHVRFRHQDWIGTERFRTTYTGTVEGTFLSLPYGDGLQASQGTNTDTSHYTSLDQDETNLESATYRELGSTQGQWLSPDPYNGSYSISNPQSLNRYGYALNSPISYSDTSGLNPCLNRAGQTTCAPLDGANGGNQTYGVLVGGYLDEFDLMSIPVYGMGFNYFPTSFTTGNSQTVVIGSNIFTGSNIVEWGWGPMQVGTGFDFFTIPRASSFSETSGNSGFAPNKPGNQQPPSNLGRTCVAQAYTSAAAQPAVKPGQQDIIDGLVGAVVGALSDGTSALFSRVLKGFGLGLVSQSATHLVQQGGAFYATLNDCQAQQTGVNSPLTPPIP